LQKKGLLQVSVSPLEVRKFYEENRDSIARKPPKVSLAHIFRLVTPGKEVEEKGQKKILEIYDIILRGGDFEEVARSFSEDERTKSSGGYLGWVKRGMLGEEIEEKIFPLKEGEISQPFRSPLGYEIYRCEKKREDAILVRHILIKVTPSREDTLREMNLLRQIRKKALSGENFESLAQKYSQDFETAKNGGYLGEFYIQQLPPQFQKILEKLEEGEISEPFFWLSETEAGTVGGFHILKVLDKEEEKFLPFEEMEEQIRNYLLEKKINEKSEEYLKRVEERTYIKTD
jgi:peptidyl-prolyl cis-trans isomerase SurA